MPIQYSVELVDYTDEIYATDQETRDNPSIKLHLKHNLSTEIPPPRLLSFFPNQKVLQKSHRFILISMLFLDGFFF